MNEQLINFLYYKKEADNAEKKLSQPMIKYLNRLGIYDLQGLKTALRINKDNVRDIQQRAKTAYNLIQSNDMEESSSADIVLKNKANDTQSNSSTNIDMSKDLKTPEMNMSEDSANQTDKTYTIPASTESDFHSSKAKEMIEHAASSTLSNFAASQSSIISAADHSSEASSSSNVRLSDVISSHTSDSTDYPAKKHHYGHVSTKDLDQSCSKVLPKLLKFLHKTSMIDNFWVNLMCNKFHVYRKTILRTLRYLQKKGYVSEPDKFGHRDSYYGDMRYQQP